jgi:excisionase family DNA binding protein
MSIEVSTFREPLYTRRTSFNHDYDITLNEVTKASNNNAFSEKGYALALLSRLELYSFHEKKLFLEYQLRRSKDPQRWLLDFERLVEINNWKSEFEFINYRTKALSNLPKIISELFKNIEDKNYASDVTDGGNQQNNNAVFNSTEACTYLNIAKSTLYKLTSDKAIAFFKPNGKNMYFKKEDLDEYISQSKQISNSELETRTNDYLSRGWNP